MPGIDPVRLEGAELPLRGGRVTPGVFRVGNTVRRPPSGNAALVRQLLRYLSDRGFDGAPAWLGTDARGRETFGFIEGTVPADLGYHDDDALRAAASLIRRFHDLGSDLAGEGLVICHNDLSPCNFVFRDGLPVAMIDFDAAAPGPPVRDLGYAAWLWLDIGGELPAAEQGRRLTLFCMAYGDVSTSDVVLAMIGRQADLARAGAVARRTPLQDWSAGCLAWTLAYRSVLIGG